VQSLEQRIPFRIETRRDNVVITTNYYQLQSYRHGSLKRDHIQRGQSDPKPRLNLHPLCPILFLIDELLHRCSFGPEILTKAGRPPSTVSRGQPVR
jgi:hypothetical protein